jgi:hypothetical protein
MKLNKSLVWSLVLMIVIAAVYRAIPGRPWGFTPQIAMALFGGAVIKDKKWALALPLFSMFLSDVLYQVLYNAGVSSIPGFYEGQIANYTLFALLTCLGFLMKRVTIANVLGYSLLAPVLFFLSSNFLVWMAGAGLQRPKTFAGLMMCYTDALPFFRGEVLGTLAFGAVLFGSHYLLTKKNVAQHTAFGE